jgi:hypothetical protein
MPFFISLLAEVSEEILQILGGCRSKAVNDHPRILPPLGSCGTEHIQRDTVLKPDMLRKNRISLNVCGLLTLVARNDKDKGLGVLELTPKPRIAGFKPSNREDTDGIHPRSLRTQFWHLEDCGAESLNPIDKAND